MFEVIPSLFLIGRGVYSECSVSRSICFDALVLWAYPQFVELISFLIAIASFGNSIFGSVVGAGYGDAWKPYTMLVDRMAVI